MKKYLKPAPPRDIRLLELLNPEEYNLDFEPPYQRKFVWSQLYKKELLKSIFDDMPINTIHLVKNGVKYYVMDGKQRLSSVKEFIENPALKIKLDGIDQEIGYDNLKDLRKTNDVARKYWDILSKYSVSICEWPPMSFLEQSQVFDKINYSKELVKQERIFAKYFYFKMAIDTLIADEPAIHNLYKLMNFTQDQKNRNADRLFVARWLNLCCFGKNNIKNPNVNYSGIKSMTMDTLSEFAENFHTSYIKYLETIDDDEVQTKNANTISLARLKIFLDKNSNINFISDILDITNHILRGAQTIDKVFKNASWKPWHLIRYTSYLLDKYNDKILTRAMLVEDNYENIELMSQQYYSWLYAGSSDENDKKSRRPHNPDVFKMHNESLDNILSCHYDTGYKIRKRPNESESISALNASNNRCCMCGKEFKHNSDIEFDHTKSISLNSTYDWRALHAWCNRKLQNSTSQNLLDGAAYKASVGN